MQEDKIQQALALIQEVKNNIELRLKVLKLNTLLKTSSIMADLVTNTFTILCVLLAFLFGTFTLGWYFSHLFGSYILGFGALTLFYVLVAIIVGALKSNLLEKALMDFTIAKYFRKYGSRHEDKL